MAKKKLKVLRKERREPTRPAAPPEPMVITSLSTSLDAVASRVAAYVQKKTGTDSLTRLSDEGAYPEVDMVVPTGLPSLDAVFGCGGLPLRKLVEVIGPESSGKTTLTKYLAGRCQLCNVLPTILDVEQSGVMAYDEGLKMNPAQATGGQPDTMEEVFQLLEATMEALKVARAPGYIFYDSVAATPLASELALGFDEEGRMAARASYLSRNLPKMVKALKDVQVGLLFVNQLREKIGAMPYQKQTYSPGGRALRHWAHIRLEMTPMGQIKSGDTVVGIKTRVRAIKNKLAPPYRETVLEIRFDPPRVLELGTGDGAKPRRTPMQRN